MNRRVGVSFICLCLIFVSLLLSKQSRHIGEQRMLDVNIQFFNASGKTITNANGVYYYFWGYVIHEDKVYPSRYWGEYPLYFVGRKAGVKVTITNRGPRAKAKVRIKTEAYVLLPNGSNGATLMAPKIIDIEVARGQTKTIDASFLVPDGPDIDSGLDRFLVKVLHINHGGGPGNSEPGLIMVKEGVFCPPK